jgi:uncharacterized tellurite resistance protein B-like protein
MTFADILKMFRQDQASAQSHVKNLIEIALADRSFSAEEEQLLKSIATRIGISMKQIEKIRQGPQTIAFEVPGDEYEKFHQVYDLVHMMIIDKAVHPEELRLCELFALKFGYPLGVVKELIGTIRSNIDNKNGVEETYKRITAYLKL